MYKKAKIVDLAHFYYIYYAWLRAARLNRKPSIFYKYLKVRKTVLSYSLSAISAARVNDSASFSSVK